jgi:hypothetical protein
VSVGTVIDDGRRAEQRPGEAIPQVTGVGLQTLGKTGIRKGRGDRRHYPPFRMVEHFCAADLALAFRHAHPSEGQQFGQPPVARAIRRPRQVGRAVVQHQARPDDEAEFKLLGGDMCAHHPGQAVAVADADAGMTKHGCGRDHFSGMRRTVEQREVGARAEFCEGDGHAR